MAPTRPNLAQQGPTWLQIGSKIDQLSINLAQFGSTSAVPISPNMSPTCFPICQLGCLLLTLFLSCSCSCSCACYCSYSCSYFCSCSWCCFCSCCCSCSCSSSCSCCCSCSSSCSSSAHAVDVYIFFKASLQIYMYICIHCCVNMFDMLKHVNFQSFLLLLRSV